MRRIRTIFCVVSLVWILANSSCTPREEPAQVVANQERKVSEKPTNQRDEIAANHPEAKVVEFQPGIRIDYRVPQVEVDAVVNLRKGELELFAYCKAPTPKEHETILKMDVKAEHVFQALGLIGLKPGNPVMYDWETEKITAASGDAVDVLVRFEEKGRTIERPAWEWMHDLKRDAVMAPTHWLFTGSRRDERGRFAADVEGTLVTVVNFDTAVLTLPESHSESNSDLWVAARTEVIPPVGTKVVLVLRPAQTQDAATSSSSPAAGN
jgi:hypothetical protein